MFAGAARTIAFTLLIVMAALTDGKKIEVTGRLLCCDKIHHECRPIKGAKVELWEQNKVVLPDYLIGRTHANDDGHFGLKGEQTFNSLDSGSAFLRIEHNCSRKPSCKAVKRWNFDFNHPSYDNDTGIFERGDIKIFPFERVESISCPK